MVNLLVKETNSSTPLYVDETYPNQKSLMCVQRAKAKNTCSCSFIPLKKLGYVGPRFCFKYIFPFAVLPGLFYKTRVIFDAPCNYTNKIGLNHNLPLKVTPQFYKIDQLFVSHCTFYCYDNNCILKIYLYLFGCELQK